MSSTTIQILNTTILFANQFPGSTLGTDRCCLRLSFRQPWTVVITDYGAQIVLTDVTPVVASGQIGFGTSTATTASTTTGGATLPAKAAVYLEINIAGTIRKIPYYAN